MFTAFVLNLMVGWASAQIHHQPEQIHISLGNNPTEMIVTWVTMHSTEFSFVEYGETGLTNVVKGGSTLFIDGGDLHRKMRIHRVTLTSLKPGQRYFYHCGSTDGWSAIYWFRTIKEGTKWSPRIVFYGDLGNINAQSLSRLQEEVQHDTYDLLLHIGDFAYDMNSDNALVGDEFMRQIEPIAAYLPYMTAVGDHEGAYNFSNYDNRFSMVGHDGKMNNRFYSFKVGPAIIIAFSTEFYFGTQNKDEVANQFHWLENELKEANKKENREKRPWIITMGHRPMYCSNLNHDDCTEDESITRKGLRPFMTYGLEDLFYKYGVDLELWAHEHSYERLWPVYDKKIYNGSYEHPYTNPKAPVHIITGSAGCKEKLDLFGRPKPWTAHRMDDYGYTRMVIINETHLYVEEISDDQNGKVVDTMLLIKEVHGPEAWLQTKQ